MTDKQNYFTYTDNTSDDTDKTMENLHKQIQDPCDKCDVEPPALKFKCPKCEHNKENKQIIIDGVDVSGCEYYDKNKPLLTCTCEEYACSECHNCYYKQFKRSEAQCEVMFVTHTDLEKKYKAKEQECKSLRNLLAEHNDVMKINELMMKEFGIEILKDITTGDITLRSIKLIELKQDCEELKNKLARSLTDKREKEIIIDQLKADNEELKEYIKHLHNLCGNETDKQYRYKQTLDEIKEEIDYVNNHPCGEGTRAVALHNILQKISEVEECR